MKFWDQIISSASLGTSKAPITSQHLPSYLQDQIPALPATDVEEEFLMIASIASQYRVGGHLPFTIETEALAPAQEEVQSQVSAKASSILNAVLAEDLLSLIHLWLRLCHQNRLRVAPDALPAVLELGSKRKELRSIIRAVIGNRGEWLCQLNPAWHFYISSMEADTMWQTGTPEERKEIIRALRITNPERAIDLMKSTWDTEGAQDKAVFLELLRINLSAQDLPWLQSLKEKGQKVNSLIQYLLKSIPGSQVVESYWSVLRKHTRIKSSKALLGMMNKTTLEVDEVLQVPEEIFKSGIEKLSSSKNITDHQHITYQLIAGIPPSYWNNHFKESGKVIIELFQKEKDTSYYVHALAQASLRFGDVSWISDILNFAKTDLFGALAPAMIRALPPSQRDDFALRFIEVKPQEIVTVMTEQNEEWSHALAKEILKHTSSEVYLYNKNFYRAALALIPLSIAPELNSLGPSEEAKKPYWNNLADELKRILELKKQVIQSF